MSITVDASEDGLHTSYGGGESGRTDATGRAWFPELAEPQDLGDVLATAGSDACLLEPRAEHPLGTWIASRRAAGAGKWTLIVGPEGGWTESEREKARASGAGEGRIAAYVLRVETAAEAGLAVLVQG